MYVRVEDTCRVVWRHVSCISIYLYLRPYTLQNEYASLPSPTDAHQVVAVRRPQRADWTRQWDEQSTRLANLEAREGYVEHIVIVGLAHLAVDRQGQRPERQWHAHLKNAREGRSLSGWTGTGRYLAWQGARDW